MEYTLSVAQAAKQMGVGPKGVLDLIESGVLPAAKPGKGYILRVADVVKHIDLIIAVETSRRIEKAKHKDIEASEQTPAPAVSTAKRGRKRNSIPVLPNH